MNIGTCCEYTGLGIDLGLRKECSQGTSRIETHPRGAFLCPDVLYRQAAGKSTAHHCVSTPAALGCSGSTHRPHSSSVLGLPYI